MSINSKNNQAKRCGKVKRPSASSPDGSQAWRHWVWQYTEEGVLLFGVSVSVGERLRWRGLRPITQVTHGILRFMVRSAQAFGCSDSYWVCSWGKRGLCVARLFTGAVFVYVYVCHCLDYSVMRLLSECDFSLMRGRNIWHKLRYSTCIIALVCYWLQADSVNQCIGEYGEHK